MSTVPKAPFSKRIITLHYSADDISRSDCEFDTSHLGKFESEPIYIPFMWNRILMWGELPNDQETEKTRLEYCEFYDIDPELEIESDDPDFWVGDSSFDRYVYHPTMEDRLYFPELDNVESVVLWESDQGFVNSETRYTDSYATIFVGL